MNQTEINHDQFPLVQRLRQAHLDRQDVDFNKIIFSGIPWLPLSVAPPKLDSDLFAADIKQWFYPEGLTIDSLQNAAFTQSNWVGHNTAHRLESEPEQRLWQGRILFGPEEWLAETYTGTLYVEYTMARRFRHRMPCAWALDENHPIRQFVQTLVQEHNLYSVTAFMLPPTEYLDPHMDYNQGMKIGLSSIFWGAQWDEGNDFGIAGFGLVPIKQDWVGLIDTFNHPHWVHNRSERDRVGIVINLEHSAISTLIEDSWRDIWR